MLRAIFIILIVINILLFLLTHKRVSYLLVYFLSSCLYYFGAIIGHSFSSSNNHISGIFTNEVVNEKTYIIMIINMLCILIFLIIGLIRDKKNLPTAEDAAAITNRQDTYYSSVTKMSEKYAVRLLMIINAVLAFFFVLPSAYSAFTNVFDKADLLEESSSVVSYYKAISSFLFVYLFTQKRIKYSKIDFVAVIAFIILTVLLGHRSFLVISIIGVCVYRINASANGENLLHLCKKHWKKLFCVALLFVAFMFSKNIYTAFMNGNYDLVSDRLADSSYYVNSFKQNEFNTIFVNLDTVVKTGYTFPLKNYLRALFVFIPFVNRYIDIAKFSTSYQVALFNTNIRASTYLGEAYACGSFALVAVVVVLVLFLLSLFDKKIPRAKSNITRTFLILAAVDLAFYIHRNSLEFSFSRIRFFLYVALLVGLFKHFFRKMSKR